MYWNTYMEETLSDGTGKKEEIMNIRTYTVLQTFYFYTFFSFHFTLEFGSLGTTLVFIASSIWAVIRHNILYFLLSFNFHANVIKCQHTVRYFESFLTKLLNHFLCLFHLFLHFLEIQICV